MRRTIVIPERSCWNCKYWSEEWGSDEYEYVRDCLHPKQKGKITRATSKCDFFKKKEKENE